MAPCACQMGQLLLQLLAAVHVPGQARLYNTVADTAAQAARGKSSRRRRPGPA